MADIFSGRQRTPQMAGEYVHCSASRVVIVIRVISKMSSAYSSVVLGISNDLILAPASSSLSKGRDGPTGRMKRHASDGGPSNECFEYSASNTLSDDRLGKLFLFQMSVGQQDIYVF